MICVARGRTAAARRNERCERTRIVFVQLMQVRHVGQHVRRFNYLLIDVLHFFYGEGSAQRLAQLRKRVRNALMIAAQARSLRNANEARLIIGVGAGIQRNLFSNQTLCFN